MQGIRLAPALVLVLSLLAGLGMALAGAGEARALPLPYQSGCAADTSDASTLLSITEPPGVTEFFVTGTAPLTVGVTFVNGVIAYPTGALSLSILWGDGASTPVSVVPCGVDDEVEVPAQTLRHTYAAPGQYLVSLYINFPIFPIAPATFASIAVSQPAPATAVPTATPVPPSPAPSQATVAPGVTTRTPAPTVTPSSGATVTTVEPGASPTSSPPAPTGSPAGTPSPTPSPTATPAVGAAPGDSPPPGSAPATDVPHPGEPDIVRSIAPLQEISTSPAVVATNLVIAGCTVWVLFTSVLLNQVLDERRILLEAKLAALRRNLRPVRPSVRWIPGLQLGRARPLADLAVVFLLTGLIYAFLQPGTGLNRETAIMLTAALVGSTGVAIAVSTVEAAALRRWTGVGAAIRAYPLALGVAVASVTVSRVLGLNPGIMYGFVASSVALGHLDIDRATEGRIAAVPITAGLALALLAWLGFGVLSSIESSSFLVVAAEATLIVVFIEGLEGIAFSLVPLSVTDGGKLFNWNRFIWGALALVCAFAAWHVLVGRDRQYFSGLREASSVTVLIIFLAYSALTLSLWLLLRKPPAAPAESPIGADGG